MIVGPMAVSPAYHALFLVSCSSYDQQLLGNMTGLLRVVVVGELRDLNLAAAAADDERKGRNL